MPATAKDWFDTYKPPGKVVKEYAMAPPHGMSNPPMNPKVRKQLLRDLQEYGVAHCTESWSTEWPPSTGRSQSVPDLDPRQRLFTSVSLSSGPSVSTLGSMHSKPFYSAGRSLASTSSSPVVQRPRRAYVYSGPGGKEEPRNPKEDARGMVHGLPTARWNSVAIHLEDRDRLQKDKEQPKVTSKTQAKPGRRTLVEAELTDHRNAIQKSRTSGSETAKQTKQDSLFEAKRAPDFAVSDLELHNGKEALRGQAGLHRAALSDRFRFASDISRGAPLCIKGAGTSGQYPANVWASDASVLITLHNNAVRGVNPSKLQPVAEDKAASPKKLKKDDVDFLQLSESALFKPKYPIDESLKVLRRLKRKHFPEEFTKEEEQKRIEREKKLLAEQVHRQEICSNLGSVFHIKHLAEEDEMNAAVVAAGCAGL